MPTLVMHRAGDLAVSVEHGRYLAQHIRGAKYVEFAGADHYRAVNGEELLAEMREFMTGVRPAPDPDRVLATVVFTDIADSTRTAVDGGDRRWRQLLERHHATVREQISRFRGREIDTAGDGFLIAFDGPARAVRAATAIVSEVSKTGIDLRPGAHTGECEVMGGKLSGVAVHIGARVSALAAAGDVLVSSTVKDFVAGSGLRFREHGVHQLKGVPGAWQLYSVERG